MDEHLAGCDACRHEAAADAELDRLLEGRLSRPRAPDRLVRALEERWVEAPARAAPSPRWPRAARTMAAMAAGAAIALAAVFAWRAREPDPMLVGEAVNDHLRVVYSDHPLEVESGGIHQVKPWFTGRLDFAPVVEFGGDDDFPLLGGAVGYFVDRKAATFVFKRRLHVITLFVFRADGLRWPAAGLRPIGGRWARSRRRAASTSPIWRGRPAAMPSSRTSTRPTSSCSQADQARRARLMASGRGSTATRSCGALDTLPREGRLALALMGSPASPPMRRPSWRLAAAPCIPMSAASASAMTSPSERAAPWGSPLTDWTPARTIIAMTSVYGICSRASDRAIRRASASDSASRAAPPRGSSATAATAHRPRT